MPPWAYWVLQSVIPVLVTTITRPNRLASIAARRPAIPLPITGRTSREAIRINRLRSRRTYVRRRRGIDSGAGERDRAIACFCMGRRAYSTLARSRTGVPLFLPRLEATLSTARSAVVRCALIACLAWAATAGAQPEDAEQRLREFLYGSKVLLREWSDSIDRAEFDLDAQAARLGSDPLMAFAFVRDHIRYEAYPGALRGAQGCLRSGAGNAVDQSILLIELLRRSGHRASLVFGTLDETTACSLIVDSAAWWSKGRVPDLDLPYALDVASVREERAAALAALDARVQRRMDRLLAALDGALGDRARGGTAARGGVPLATAVSWARAHVWVRLHRDDGDLDLDPSFAFFGEPGQRHAEAERVAEQIPEEIWHRIRFRGLVEVHAGGQVREEVLFETSHRAPDLAGAPIVLECARDAEAGAGAMGVALAGKGRHRLVLRIAGEEAGSGTFVLGRSDAKRNGGGFGGMLGGLGGEERAAPSTVSVGVEAVLTGPGGAPCSERRYLLDAWGHRGRQVKDVGALKSVAVDAAAVEGLEGTALCFAVETGAVNGAFVQARILAAILAAFESLQLADGKLRCTAESGDLAARLFADAYLHYFDAFVARRLDHAGWSAEPRLLMTAVGTAAEVRFLRFDVTRDPRSFLRESPYDAYRSGFEAGLLAAILEEELTLDPLSPPAEARVPHGSARALEDSLPRGAPLRIESGGALPPASVEAQSRMRAALESGRILIVPVAQPTELPFAWFELDPATGVLEAALETGLHEGSTEYTLLQKYRSVQTKAAHSFANLIRNVMQCVVKNLDELFMGAINATVGGVDLVDAVELAQAGIQCFLKTRGSKAHRNPAYDWRGMKKPTVADPELRKIVKELYRPGAEIGSGSTADAIRHTLRTEDLVKGSDHLLKGKQKIQNLADWLKANPHAGRSDRKAAQDMIMDLLDAIHGPP